MPLIDQFYRVIEARGVQQQARELMRFGQSQPHFIHYFGVNFDDENLVSVKLYFSFQEMPPAGLFDAFEVKDDFRKLILENWKPAKPYTYLHQGLTFGLKCYLKQGQVATNRYIHFRSPNFVMGYPQQLILQEEDKANYPGFCIESHAAQDELKQYYYLSSAQSKAQVLRDFGLDTRINPETLPMVEYTESSLEKKVNLVINSSEDVAAVLAQSGNKELDSLNRHFYDHHQLYFFAPGFRHNSRTQAIYYLPRSAYYTMGEVKTLGAFINKEEAYH